ncbi:uncharacterized protein LOC125199398 [Salvia hispanica]|uniref:uncharacterized protein LOC125199398 n=1 Tax=Salvia hispanica TaxID=49212 RepID=UPI002009C24A|nr:uncharacterized protein LOC125199398 [Salvia hispanica]
MRQYDACVRFWAGHISVSVIPYRVLGSGLYVDRLAISSCNEYIAVGLRFGIVIVYKLDNEFKCVSADEMRPMEMEVTGLVFCSPSHLNIAYIGGDICRVVIPPRGDSVHHRVWEGDSVHHRVWEGDVVHHRVSLGDVDADGFLTDYTGSITICVGVYDGERAFRVWDAASGSLLYSGGSMDLPLGDRPKVVRLLSDTMVLACSESRVCYFFIADPAFHMLAQGSVRVGTVGSPYALLVGYLDGAARSCRLSPTGDLQFFEFVNPLQFRWFACLTSAACVSLGRTGDIQTLIPGKEVKEMMKQNS